MEGMSNVDVDSLQNFDRDSILSNGTSGPYMKKLRA